MLLGFGVVLGFCVLEFFMLCFVLIFSVFGGFLMAFLFWFGFLFVVYFCGCVLLFCLGLGFFVGFVFGLVWIGFLGCLFLF